MARPLTDLIQPRLRVATDSEARVTFVTSAASRPDVVEVQGTIDGPRCLHARTLPTSFPLRPERNETDGVASAESLVADPCFWTPALPFLYTLSLEARMTDGTNRALNHQLGLRRWYAAGANLRLERKRFVLRGTEVSHTALAKISDARAVESAFIVRHPNTVICEAADREGIAIVADLRRAGSGLSDELRLYAWHPSVMIAIVDDAGDDHVLRSFGPLLAKTIVTSDATPPADRDRYDLFAAEFAPGERPPAWLADCGKPVIAIRRGASYATLGEARERCDGLQADLAPEFNLAGYFVTN